MHQPSHHGLVWDWAPETWAWSPSEGRWTPEQGRPNGCVRLQVSTGELAPEDAYDYWRETVYYHFDADRRRGSASLGFQAEAVAIIAPRCEFYVYRSDGLSGRRTAKQVRADGGDDLDIGLVLSGERNIRDDADSVVAASAGDFYAYDSARPSRVQWDAHDGLHLKLRRDAVTAAFGGDVPPVDGLAGAVAASRLSPFLKTQLATLAKHAAELPERELAAILDNTADLALTVLRSAYANSDVLDETPRDRNGLFVAARRFIAKRLADPNLGPDLVAHALGCSRATLYRIFAGHGVTVASYIREERLQQVMRYLQSAAGEETIASLARRCGFYDASNFGRIFRRRFGMNPGDVRG